MPRGGGPQGARRLRVQAADGNPSGYPNTLVLPSGSVTDDGGGQFTYTAPVSVFGEAFSAATSPAAAGVWEDWDVSGTVPSGARVAFILALVLNGRSHGVRRNGSATDRRLAVANVAIGVPLLWVVDVSADRTIERYVAGAAADVTFRVVGWV